MCTPIDSSAYIMSKGGSAASHHYSRESDIKCLTNIKINNTKSIVLPNTIESAQQGILPLEKELSKTAKTALVLPNLQSAPLITLGQLCDDNYNITLNKNTFEVYKNNTNILKGYRNHRDSLWDALVAKIIIQEDSYKLPHIIVNYTKKALPQFTASITEKRYKSDIDLLRCMISPMESLIKHNCCDKAIHDQMKHDHKMNHSIYQLHDHRYNNSLE